MIEHFLVKDIYGSMIELVYDRKDYTKYHLIMIEDSGLPSLPDFSDDDDDDDYMSIGGYVKPDTFIVPEFYSFFERRVFEYMARTDSEISWIEPYVDYIDFLKLLEEAEEIYYDRFGMPHFINAQ